MPMLYDNVSDNDFIYTTTTMAKRFLFNITIVQFTIGTAVSVWMCVCHNRFMFSLIWIWNGKYVYENKNRFDWKYIIKQMIYGLFEHLIWAFKVS